MYSLALSSWSLHTAFLNQHVSGLTPSLFPRFAKENFGIRKIEFFEGDYATDFMDSAIDADYAAGIKAACRDANVEVVCIAAVNDLTNHSRERVQLDIQRIKKWVEHCSILGCSIVRINTGSLSLTFAIFV